MRGLIRILLVVMLLGMGSIAWAQAQEAKVVEVETSENGGELDYKQVSAEFLQMEEDIKANKFTRQSLEDDLNILSEKEMAIDALIRSIEKQSKYAQDALAAIGEAPAEGEIEDESIAEMREKYATAVAGYKSKIIEANLLKTEISRLNAMITEARSQVLLGNLVAEKNTLISPKNFFKAINDAMVFLWQVTRSPVDWYLGLSDAGRAVLYHNVWYVLLILGMALSVGLWLRKFIIWHWGYKHTDDQPRYAQKIVVACVTALAYGVIPSILLGGCLLWQITNEELTSSRFGVVLANVLWYSLFMTLTRAATRVVLAPWNGRWRLFNISDERAERVFSGVTLSIILLGTVECLRNIAQYFEVSEQLQLLIEVSVDAVKAFAIILITARVFEEIKPKDKDDDEREGADVEITAPISEEEEGLSFSFKVILFVSLFAIVTFGVSLFGYPGLATFIFNRFFFSILLGGAFVMVRMFISDLLRRSIVFWIKTFKMRRRLLSKVDFLMSLMITPVLVMFLIYSLLRLWGVPSNFMLNGIKKLVFGFKVGGIQISLVAIFTGFLIFFISLTLVRVLKRRMASNLLTRINMDEGIKHSLVSGFGFTGFIISAILGMVAMGVDLSNLAFIAGALSVGIGFGLQDVIKNFVSGIIILFERPFKVGDWVILGGEEGKIKQINIRSTELETWTRRSVIIPNATLISSSLVNLTHGNNWQRQTIMVGVSYDSDADQVTQMLLECAKASKKVAKVPMPYVIFKEFGSSSLDFELRFYVSNIWDGWSAGSDIRYEILRRFREAGINIAYPQIVIHQGSEDTSVKGWQTNV
ncbi:MAG: mechanosensitive ion channel [Acetobacter sp.]|nr:mechanosensitive ion channel [Acetobacter sp.]